MKNYKNYLDQNISIIYITMNNPCSINKAYMKNTSYTAEFQNSIWFSVYIISEDLKSFSIMETNVLMPMNTKPIYISSTRWSAIIMMSSVMIKHGLISYIINKINNVKSYIWQKKVLKDLTHLPLVPHICISESDQHWFRKWLATYSVPSHYLNQYWVNVKWIFRNKL